MADFPNASPPLDKVTAARTDLVTVVSREYSAKYGTNPIVRALISHRAKKRPEQKYLVEIDRICQGLNSSRMIRDEAARLAIRLAGIHPKFHRTTILSMAIVLAAYRTHGYPMEVGRIVSRASLPTGFQRKVIRAYEELNGLGVFGSTKIRRGPTPHELIERILPQLREYGNRSSESELRRIASTILKDWESRRLAHGRRPAVLAATAIYEAGVRLGLQFSTGWLGKWSMRVVAQLAYIQPRSIIRFRKYIRSQPSQQT